MSNQNVKIIQNVLITPGNSQTHLVAEIIGFKKIIKTLVSEHVNVDEFNLKVKSVNSLMSLCMCVQKFRLSLTSVW